MIAIKVNECFRNRKFAIGCSAGFAVLSLWLISTLYFEPETPVLRLSAGPESTRRHAVATWLSELSSQNNLDIDLFPNAGSEDSLNQLQSNQLDLALVSSGVIVPDDDDIVVLGGMQLEAVHVLVRKEMSENVSLVDSIRGKRVNLGEKGSSEWLLSRELLAFARLQLPSDTHPGDVIPTEFTKSELMKNAKAILQAEGTQKDALVAELPDCLLVLSSVPSPMVQLLVEAAYYQIRPLPATRAFLLDNMSDSEAKTTVVKREFLEPASIPKHSYFAKQGFPTGDCETVGIRLLLVARRDLPSNVVKALMKTVFESEFQHRILPQSPRKLATSYPVHPAAVSYLDRNKPLIVQEMLGWLDEGLSIFGAFAAGALSLYSLLRRAKTRNPSDYFSEIQKVEQLAQLENLDPAGPIQRKELIKHLDERLIRIRHDLVMDICEGRIKGDQNISNILMLLKDARRSLALVEAQIVDSDDRSLGIRKLAREAA
jgi:TRAP-type uncharacterized transport system substrate-binding protein